MPPKKYIVGVNCGVAIAVPPSNGDLATQLQCEGYPDLVEISKGHGIMYSDIGSGKTFEFVANHSTESCKIKNKEDEEFKPYKKYIKEPVDDSI